MHLYNSHSNNCKSSKARQFKLILSREFVGEKCYRHWDSNPLASDFEHLALRVSHLYGFFTTLCLSWSPDRQPLSFGGPSGHHQPAIVAPGLPRLCRSSLDRGVLKQPNKLQLRGPASRFARLFNQKLACRVRVAQLLKRR